MARRKYKSTGCARFFLVLVILIPLAYFGAKMINDGEGIPAVDQFIERIFDGNDSDDNSDSKTLDADVENEVKQLKTEINQLRDRIYQLEQENSRLKDQLNSNNGQ